MGLIINKRKHLYTRLPIGLLSIIFLALAPIIIGLIGSWITEYTTGKPCHEGNCGWMALPWLSLVTLPAGALGLIGFIVIVVIDSTKLKD